MEDDVIVRFFHCLGQDSANSVPVHAEVCHVAQSFRPFSSKSPGEVFYNIHSLSCTSPVGKKACCASLLTITVL